MMKTGMPLGRLLQQFKSKEKENDALGLGVTGGFGERPNGFGYILDIEQIKLGNGKYVWGGV